MKTKHLLLILLLPLLAAQCKKEEAPDLPCLSYFKCNIDGEPFVTRGKWGCPSKNLWYDRNSGDLVISGRNCDADFGEPLIINFYLFGAFQTGEYTPVWGVALTLADSTNSLRYDSTLTGKVSLTTFVLENYSADYSNGVIAGTFEFTLWNTAINDTVRITNGDFCMRMY